MSRTEPGMANRPFNIERLTKVFLIG